MDDEIEVALRTFDPDSIFRAIALICASITDKTGDPVRITLASQVFFDQLDPFALKDSPFGIPPAIGKK